MRTSGTCYKCQCRRFWVVNKIGVPDPTTSNTVATLPVAAQDVGERYRREGGSFEVWVCANCGFTEWYANDAAGVLQMLARLPGGAVRWVDATAPGGPFR